MHRCNTPLVPLVTIATYQFLIRVLRYLVLVESSANAIDRYAHHGAC